MFKALKKLIYIIVTIALILSAKLALAKPLYIEITGGDNVGIPAVVLPFFENFQSYFEGYENIPQIISNDLKNSGQFKLLDNYAYDESQDPEKIDTDLWRIRGAEYIISGKIIKSGKNEHTIEVNLINVFRNDDNALTKFKFTNQRKENFRALAHYISDRIFQKLIGVPGIFSTRIAYITMKKEGEELINTLTIADYDGHNDQVIIEANYPLMSPAWSPDGKKIAFVSFKGNRSSIKILHLNDGYIEEVTNFPGINGAPAWSPDGTKLALVLSKSGYPKIYVMDLSQRKLERLTDGASIDTEPYWTPDGKSLFFTSNKGGKPQIYSIDLLTKTSKRITFKGDYNATPSITHDGKKLIMMHRNKRGDFNIAMQSLVNGKIKILTEANLDESPTLAPNGMMVLYGSKEADRYILGAVSLDGRFKMRLPLKDGNVKDPDWSPYLLRNS